MKFEITEDAAREVVVAAIATAAVFAMTQTILDTTDEAATEEMKERARQAQFNGNVKLAIAVSKHFEDVIVKGIKDQAKMLGLTPEQVGAMMINVSEQPVE